MTSTFYAIITSSSYVGKAADRPILYTKVPKDCESMPIAPHVNNPAIIISTVVSVALLLLLKRKCSSFHSTDLSFSSQAATSRSSCCERMLRQPSIQLAPNFNKRRTLESCRTVNTAIETTRLLFSADAMLLSVALIPPSSFLGDTRFGGIAY